MSRYATNRQLDAEAMVQELVEALEWYANHNQYLGMMMEKGMRWPIVADSGHKARAAIARARGGQS